MKLTQFTEKTRFAPRACLFAAAAVLLMISPRGAGEAPLVIYYDSVEGGMLTGGRLIAGPSDPVWTALGMDRTAPSRGAWQWATLQDSGPTANRMNMVIVGDGYTSTQLGLYAQHAASVVSGFFGQEPFSAYRGYFNVYRVDVVSIESGVDEPDLGIYRNTALDMTFECGGIPRLLCVDVNKAWAAAASAPAADVIVALANSPRYGGAGFGSGIITAAARNADVNEVVLHEFGHTLADLADEYDYADGTRYSGPEVHDVNASIYNAASMLSRQTKWYRWLDLPTVDAYEGCSYTQFGIYRPTSNSKMRSLYRPFEQVNVEAMVIEIYKTAGPIDGATPDPLAGVIWPAQTSFTVASPAPTGHALTVRWFVDDQPLAGATAQTYSPAALSLVPGVHRLRAQVRDDTARIRNESARQTWLTESVEWRFVSGATRPDINGDGVSDFADVAAFANVLLGRDVIPAHLAASDRNLDGRVNGADTQPFVRGFLGP